MVLYNKFREEKKVKAEKDKESHNPIIYKKIGGRVKTAKGWGRGVIVVEQRAM